MAYDWTVSDSVVACYVLSEAQCYDSQALMVIAKGLGKLIRITSSRCTASAGDGESSRC